MNNIFDDNKDIKLMDYIITNTKDSREHMGDTVPVLIYRLFQFSIKDTLNENFGKEKADEIFRKAGYQAASFICDNLVDCSLDEKSFLKVIQTTFESLKIGVMRVESFSDDEIVFTVAEDIDCSGLPVLGQTICVYDEGLIEGVLEKYYNKKYFVREIDCWATGGRVCRFKAKLEKQ